MRRVGCAPKALADRPIEHAGERALGAREDDVIGGPFGRCGHFGKAALQRVRPAVFVAATWQVEHRRGGHVQLRVGRPFVLTLFARNAQPQATEFAGERGERRLGREGAARVVRQAVDGHDPGLEARARRGRFGNDGFAKLEKLVALPFAGWIGKLRRVAVMRPDKGQRCVAFHQPPFRPARPRTPRSCIALIALGT